MDYRPLTMDYDLWTKNPTMTAIESKEIRGITLKVLYLLVAFSITATAGIMTSYFSLKADNQLLSTQIEILKVQLRQLDRRLENIEGQKNQLAYRVRQSSNKQTP